MKLLIKIITVLIIPASTIFAQKNSKVEVMQTLNGGTIVKKCKKLELGKVILFVKPIYPAQAKNERIGGTVKVQAVVGETGNVLEVLDTQGPELLQNAARTAAQKAKFSPTLCDGRVARVKALMIYNFISYYFNDIYFKPDKVEEFLDVSKNSDYYEPIINLTENYQIAFGYGDKKFHAEAPLIKGDFAHFLLLTLDLLKDKAEFSAKNPEKIGLYRNYNPYRLKSADEFENLTNKNPYLKSIGYLLSKYDIALADKQKTFNGDSALTTVEVIFYWSQIFGEDAVPINFKQASMPEKILTRGEFSLFLQESLYVLTYKVLP